MGLRNSRPKSDSPHTRSSEAQCETIVNEDGSWIAVLPPQDAQRNAAIELSDGITTLAFTDVCVGEVWLAGGQSNMEYYLHFDAEKESVLNGPVNQDIRFFDYPKASYEGALNDYDFRRFGFWRTCTKDDLPYFSAVAYYFAESLHQSIDIPIGIVGCNYGGTVACAWVDPEYLKGTESEIWVNEYESAVRNLDLDRYRKEYLANPANDRSNPLKPQDGIMGRMFYPGFSKSEQEQLTRLMSPSPETGLPPFIGPYIKTVRAASMNQCSKKSLHFRSEVFSGIRVKVTM
jgi:sialate O-acetylesterase